MKNFSIDISKTRKDDLDNPHDEVHVFIATLNPSRSLLFANTLVQAHESYLMANQELSIKQLAAVVANENKTARFDKLPIETTYNYDLRNFMKNHEDIIVNKFDY